MSYRSGADVVHDALVRLDVECLFAVASVHNLPILHAVHARDRIRVVSVRHEQSAVSAADGYARATGRLGVALTSTGPGAANAMGGLFEAAFASSRVLMLTGQIETAFLGRGRGFIHEADRQLEMLRTVAPHAFSVERVEDVADTVMAAARAVLGGRPRPGVVEIPIDIQYAATDVVVPPPVPVHRSVPQAASLDQAAELLGSARWPIIWSGGGVLSSGAWPELTALAERLSIPVVTSTQGRGALPEDHPLCLGSLTAAAPIRQLIERADVLLAVGTRFQMYPTDHWRVAVPPGLIHVDIDPGVIGRTYRPQVAVVADAVLALAELDKRCASTAMQDGWVDEARSSAARARAEAHRAIGPDHSALVDVIRRHLPAGGAVVRDCTVPAYYWGDTLLPVLQPRTSVNPASAAIGPGLPLALGAAIGLGVRSVVLHGDGGIMLSVAELATLAQFDVPLTVCVFVDGGYGVLRGIQEATFGPGAHDVDLPAPDFVALAESMGVPAARVVDVAGFASAFKRSTVSDGPFLIEVDLTRLAPMLVREEPQLLLGPSSGSSR